MRLVLRFAVGLAALTAMAQAWVTFDWIGDLSNHCDYPDECLSSWLPSAFAIAEYLWIATALAGATAVTAAGLLHRPRIDIAALGGAWAAAFISYCLTPMVQATPGEPIVDWRPVEANFFWGGPGYAWTALLMAAAGAVFGWQLVRSRKSAAEREAPAGNQQVADAH